MFSMGKLSHQVYISKPKAFCIFVIFRPHQTLMDIGTLCSLEMFSLHLHQQFPDEMVANTLKLKVGGSIIFVTLDFKQ